MKLKWADNPAIELQLPIMDLAVNLFIINTINLNHQIYVC